MNKYIKLLIFSAFLFIATSAFAQQKYGYVEGSYSIGSTACSIKWDTDGTAFIIYWQDKTSATLLFFREEQMDGKMVYDEYASNRTTYTGKFTFKDSSFEEGEYDRVDGTKLSIKRR
jgi:hypothetical protein